MGDAGMSTRAGGECEFSSAGRRGSVMVLFPSHGRFRGLSLLSHFQRRIGRSQQWIELQLSLHRFLLSPLLAHSQSLFGTERS